jgi:sigma-B regulation protein RsbU (phosphoserine phosphatase)
MPTTETAQPRLDELEAGLERQKALLRDLAMMGSVITSIHEMDAVLSVSMDMALRLVDGEVGLMMTDDDGILRQKVTWGLRGEFVRSLRYKDDLDVAQYCFTKREAIILTDLDIRTDSGVTLQSLLALPIQTKERCLGVAIIVNKSGGQNFSATDQEPLEMLLNFLAVAMDNMRMIAASLERQKIQQELAIARQVQEALLPQDIHSVPGVDIGSVYFPAHEVGGDFYDVIKIDDKRFFVVLGDVSNKGVPAALVMSATSAIINTLATVNSDIAVSELTSRLNTILSEEVIGEREMFVTLFIARFDLEAKELSFCNGGHIPGLFWDETEQRVEELSEGGPIVGQFPGLVFKQGKRNLVSGDRLFLFTDGLTEATDSDGNMFGRERVEQVFSVERGLSPSDFCRRVKEWIDHFQEGTARDTHDDFTLLHVKVD